MELIINEKNQLEPTICLNMIVKNESKIIIRMLQSVLPIIDTYCICDTGSTDNTIEIINNFFQQHNILGTIINEQFVNFEHNRNVALQHAYKSQANYILLLDADMCLNIKKFNKNMLINYSGINIFQGSDDFYYKNLRIIKNNGLFKYIGVTHEYLSYPNDKGIITTTLDKNILFINDYGDGGSKTNKFQRDIQLLLKGIEDEPKNVRYYFYLANSYHDLGQYENAIIYYKKRIELGGWDQEQWYSTYRIGKCYKQLNNIEKAIYFWLQASEICSDRIENLYEIINYYRLNGKNKQAFLFYNVAKNIIKSLTESKKNTFLFLQNDKYTYKLDYEYTIIAYYLGIRHLNNEIVNVLNHSNEENITNNLLKNMKFYRNILKPKIVKNILKQDLINELTYNINGENINLNMSSSCLIKNPYGDKQGYIMNVRCVNYEITNNGNYLNCDKHIITLNMYMKLTNELNIVKNENKLFDLHNLVTDRKYLGIEDIRIFHNKLTDEIIFIGTSLHKNGQLGICNGIYDTSNNILVDNELKSGFTKRSCEKNWIYTFTNNQLYIIYEWFPLTICKINKNNILNIDKTNKEMPKIFKYARGSTCGFNYNDEIWFIVHLVNYSSPRNYYHLLVVLNKDFNLLRYSAPFNFEGEPIEYCLSLIVSNDDVIINYSTWDRSTKIAVYDKKYIDNLLVYN